jgi:hypothetical protein
MEKHAMRNTNNKCRTNEQVRDEIERYIVDLDLEWVLNDYTKGAKGVRCRIECYRTTDNPANEVLFVIRPDNGFQVYVSTAANSITDDIRQLGVMLAMGRGA